MYAPHVLPVARGYHALYRSFRWQLPARYNIGVDVCDRWAQSEPGRTAIFNVAADGAVEEVSYGALRETSNRLANVLAARGIARGDRVAILLPQGPAVAASHIAIYKLGAIALPLAMLFGVEAVSYRLQDSGARALITNAQGLAKLGEARDAVPGLEFVLSIDGLAAGAEDFHAELARAASDFTPVDTAAEDPALMVYTSGTTGPPKGALHAHRVLLGHLPGIEFPHEFLPQPGDRFWTPADWAWAGGLLNVLLPGLHYGVPVVAKKFEKFDPEEAFALMARMEVRNTFIPPTALRMLRSAPPPKQPLRLRSVGSGGEALGAETYEWGKSALGVTINEFYGQTECNLVLASCAAIGVSRAGAIGKPVPGHTVAVIRPDGSECATGEIGQIAIKRPDPVMFLEYWGKPDATRDKFIARLDDHGRPGHRRCGGLRAIRRTRRRCDHLGRLSHRSDRDRGLPDPASRRRARRGRRQARSRAHRDRQGVRRAEVRPCAVRRARRRDPGLREDAALRARISARGRLHRADADDDDGQGDPAVVAAAGVIGRTHRAPLSASCVRSIATRHGAHIRFQQSREMSAGECVSKHASRHESVPRPILRDARTTSFELAGMITAGALLRTRAEQEPSLSPLDDIPQRLRAADGRAAQGLQRTSKRKSERLPPPDAHQPIRQREPLAPDMVDHGMIGGGAGIGAGDARDHRAAPASHRAGSARPAKSARSSRHRRSSSTTRSRRC